MLCKGRCRGHRQASIYALDAMHLMLGYIGSEICVCSCQVYDNQRANIFLEEGSDTQVNDCSDQKSGAMSITEDTWDDGYIYKYVSSPTYSPTS